jgi:hypothetical protein
LVESLVLEALVQGAVVVEDGFLGGDVERRVVADTLFYLALLLLDGILLPLLLLSLCERDGGGIALDQRQLLGVTGSSAGRPVYAGVLGNQLFADDGSSLGSVVSKGLHRYFVGLGENVGWTHGS